MTPLAAVEIGYSCGGLVCGGFAILFCTFFLYKVCELLWKPRQPVIRQYTGLSPCPHPRCGNVNPGAARFCGRCGRALSASSGHHLA